MAGDWSSYWVYVAGPVAGGAIAIGCAWILRGRGGDDAARMAAMGHLDPLLSAESRPK